MLCSKTKEYIWNLIDPCQLRCSILGPEELESESALLRSGTLALSSHE